MRNLDLGIVGDAIARDAGIGLQGDRRCQRLFAVERERDRTFVADIAGDIDLAHQDRVFAVFAQVGQLVRPLGLVRHREAIELVAHQAVLDPSARLEVFHDQLRDPGGPLAIEVRGGLVIDGYRDPRLGGIVVVHDLLRDCIDHRLVAAHGAQLDVRQQVTHRPCAQDADRLGADGLEALAQVDMLEHHGIGARVDLDMLVATDPFAAIDAVLVALAGGQVVAAVAERHVHVFFAGHVIGLGISLAMVIVLALGHADKTQLVGRRRRHARRGRIDDLDRGRQAAVGQRLDHILQRGLGRHHFQDLVHAAAAQQRFERDRIAGGSLGGIGQSLGQRHRFLHPARGIEQRQQGGVDGDCLDHFRGLGGGIGERDGGVDQRIEISLGGVGGHGAHEDAGRFDRSVAAVFGAVGFDLGGEGVGSLLAQLRQGRVAALGAVLDRHGDVGQAGVALLDRIGPEGHPLGVGRTVEQLGINFSDAVGDGVSAEAYLRFFGSGKEFDDRAHVAIVGGQLGRPEFQARRVGRAAIEGQVEGIDRGFVGAEGAHVRSMEKHGPVAMPAQYGLQLKLRTGNNSYFLNLYILRDRNRRISRTVQESSI